jgi:hypothetical protein
MAKPEENEPQIAARRLAQILEEHGIAPQKHAFALVFRVCLPSRIFDPMAEWSRSRFTGSG